MQISPELAVAVDQKLSYKLKEILADAFDLNVSISRDKSIMESERLDTLSGLSSAHEFLAAILYKFQSEVRQYVDRTLNMKNFDVAIQALNKLINDEVHFAIRNLGIASHQHAIVRERIIEQIALRAFRIFSTHTTRHRKIQRKLWDKIQYDDLESIPVEHREVVKIERDTVRLPMFEKVISVTRYAAA